MQRSACTQTFARVLRLKLHLSCNVYAVVRRMCVCVYIMLCMYIVYVYIHIEKDFYSAVSGRTYTYVASQLYIYKFEWKHA